MLFLIFAVTATMGLLTLIFFFLKDSGTEVIQGVQLVMLFVLLGHSHIDYFSIKSGMYEAALERPRCILFGLGDGSSRIMISRGGGFTIFFFSY